MVDAGDKISNEKAGQTFYIIHNFNYTKNKYTQRNAREL